MKELEQQREQATAKEAKSAKLREEISKLRSQVAFQEESSAEMKKQNKQALKESAEALTQAKQWQLKYKEAQGQAEDFAKELQAAKKALAGAAQRAEQATSDALERTSHENVARARIRDLEEMQVESLRQQLTEEAAYWAEKAGHEQQQQSQAASVSSEPRVVVLTAPLTTISSMPTATVTSPALPVGSSASGGTPVSPSSGTATPCQGYTAAYPIPSYGGQAESAKKIGKITHVGTTITTADGHMVYQPAPGAPPVPMEMPSAAGASVSTMPPMPVGSISASVKVPVGGGVHSAAPVGSRVMVRTNTSPGPVAVQAHPVQMATSTGQVQGHLGVQITNVRRIR